MPVRKRRRTGHAPRSREDNSEQPNRSGGQVTPTGNYKGYYGRRTVDAYGQDTRLGLLREEWIRGSSVLDIGCNDGTFTLDVAKKFGPRRVVGLEIDGALVKKARNNLRKRAAQQKPELSSTEKDGFMPISCLVVQGGLEEAGPFLKTERKTEMTKKEEKTENIKDIFDLFPFNVTFRREDVTADDAKVLKETKEYDVVLCLSVTKWIHMAGGDCALKKLFRLVFQCLRPGGVLILEPQPEQSYKRARSKGIQQAIGIKLHPDRFCEYLINEIGFQSYETLQERRVKGTPFNRPVYALFKAKKTNDPGRSDSRV